MWEEFKDRLKFFGEIVGNLIIDSLFITVWILIHHAIEHYILAEFLKGDVPRYIKYPKYALDYAPPIVIIYFVIMDVLRSIKKLYNRMRGK
jgi:hypothetical protein